MQKTQHVHLSQHVKNSYSKEDLRIVREECKAALQGLRANGVNGEIYCHLFTIGDETFGLNTVNRPRLEIIEADFAMETSCMPRTITEAEHKKTVRALAAKRKTELDENGNVQRPAHKRSRKHSSQHATNYDNGDEE